MLTSGELALITGIVAVSFNKRTRSFVAAASRSHSDAAKARLLKRGQERRWSKIIPERLLE